MPTRLLILTLVALAIALGTIGLASNKKRPPSDGTGSNGAALKVAAAQGGAAEIVETKVAALRGATPQVAAAPPPGAGGAPLLPTGAKPGECFARVFVPAEYRMAEQRVIKRDASQRFEVVPARYEWVEEKVVVSEASTDLVEVPEVYDTVDETVVIEEARKVWRSGPSTRDSLADDGLVAIARSLGLPKDAKVKRCFAEYGSRARYEKRPEKLLIREATTRIEVIPAEFEVVEQKVLVKPATKRIEQVDAIHDWVEEQVVDQPAHTVWKKGKGPIQRVDHSTGEIMCLVEVPATYKTVRKRVLVSAASTREVEVPAEHKTIEVKKLKRPAQEKRVDVPAEYETITKRVLVKPGSLRWAPVDSGAEGTPTGRTLCRTELQAVTKTVSRRVVKTPAGIERVEIPAETKMVRVRKLVEPAKTQVIDVPAEYTTVSKRELVRDGRMEWQSILCETNMSDGIITGLQKALLDKGFDPGDIDGVIGGDTIDAMRRFQEIKGLPTGQITLATLDALGVDYAPR